MIDQVQQDLLVQGFGAFSGAFFAFLFLRLGEFFAKLYQRQVQHYNSLVKLEVQLNEIGGILHDNLYITPEFKRVIVSGNIYFNNLHQLKIDEDHYYNLYDLDFLNELYSYYYQVIRINQDIGTITSGYEDIKNALIQEHIKKPDYVVNSNLMAQRIEIIEAFMRDLLESTIGMTAKVRILLRQDKPLGTKIQHLSTKGSSKKIKDAKLKKEIDNIKLELKETGEESKKRNEEVLNKYK